MKYLLKDQKEIERIIFGLKNIYLNDKIDPFTKFEINSKYNNILFFQSYATLTLEKTKIMESIKKILIKDSEELVNIVEISNENKFSIFPIEKIEDYIHYVIGNNHLITDINFNWSILYTYRDFGIISYKRQEDFEIFINDSPDLLSQVNLFLEEIEYDFEKMGFEDKKDLIWVRNLLINIYGKTKTNYILNKYTFWSDFIV